MSHAGEFKTAAVITFDTVQQEHARLQHFIDSTHEDTVILDMSSIEQCDSAGLALMIEAKRLADSGHKACQFRAIPESVWNLARFCGVESVFSQSE